MKALTAFNPRNSGANGILPVGIKALAAFDWTNGALTAFFVGIKALTAFNRKKSGVNGV